MNNTMAAISRDQLAWQRWAIRAGLALTVLLLVVNFGKMLIAAWLALAYPYDLDYGEGIVWQQMRNIVAGEGYSPLGVYPAIVYHYPPVYHLTTAAVAALGGLDQLVAGRLVSLLSTLATMILVALLTASAIPKVEGRALRLTAAAIGALCLASVPTILTWSTFMRVDMLGCALTFAGLALTVRAIERPSAVPFAALAFVLAIYTKQTSLAGPVAALVGLWFVRPKSAGLLLIWCTSLGLVALGLLSMQSGGGFLRHILLYNMNRVDLSKWRLLVAVILSQAMLLTMAAIAAGAAWRRLFPDRSGALKDRDGRDGSKAALLILLIFLLVKTAMLPMILKSGSGDNYMIEWSCGAAVFVGLAAVPVVKLARDGNEWPSLILVVLFTVGLPIAAYRVPAEDMDPVAIRLENVRMANVVAQIRASEKPVISDDMVLLIRAGRPVQWEPAIAAELAHSKLYDEEAFAGMVRRRDFGFFLTRGDRGSRLYDERYNPIVADAIDAAYPRKKHVGNLVFHLPAQ